MPAFKEGAKNIADESRTCTKKQVHAHIKPGIYQREAEISVNGLPLAESRAI